MIAAVLALAGSVAALVAFVFWQGSELRALRKAERAAADKASELQILNAAAKVAVADKERAMNLLLEERSGLEKTVETVKAQRDDLLKEALKHATPGSAAIAVRDALERLRNL